MTWVTTYNVLAPVVELVDAETPHDAWALLADRLRHAGFQVYDDPGATIVNVDVIEAEQQRG